MARFRGNSVPRHPSDDPLHHNRLAKEPRPRPPSARPPCMYKRIRIPVGTVKRSPQSFWNIFWDATAGYLTAEIAGSAEEGGEMKNLHSQPPSSPTSASLLCAAPRSPR